MAIRTVMQDTQIKQHVAALTLKGNLVELWTGPIDLAMFGSTAFIALLIAFSFLQTGGQAGLNMLLAQTYPSSMRSTGIGWAGGMGRVGDVIGPALGGLAVAVDLSPSQTLRPSRTTGFGRRAANPAFCASRLDRSRRRCPDR